MKFQIGTMLKAIYAGAGTLLTGVAAALVGAHTFASVTDGQWITISALTLGAFGAVYGVTNAPPTIKP